MSKIKFNLNFFLIFYHSITSARFFFHTHKLKFYLIFLLPFIFIFLEIYDLNFYYHRSIKSSFFYKQINHKKTLFFYQNINTKDNKKNYQKKIGLIE